MTPFVGGEPSELYMGLLHTKNKMEVPRPLTNLIYCMYKSSDAADVMDSKGYKRNKQGEHTAADVYKFFDVKTIQNEQQSTLSVADRRFGLVDSTGERTAFNAEDAFAKAQDINASSKGFVAQVVQNGEVFNVLLNYRDARSEVFKNEVDGQMLAWQALKNHFTALGIDFNTLSSNLPDIVNPLRVKDFLYYAASLGTAKPADMFQRDILMLLALNPQSAKVQTLLGRGWGDVTHTAEKAYDILSNPSAYSSSTVKLVADTLDEIKLANRSALQTIRKDIFGNVVNPFYDKSPITKTINLLNKLNQQYGIGANVIVRKTEEIRKLSDAAADAVLILERQIRNLKGKEGSTTKGRELEQMKSQLLAEIAKKRYYIGLLNVLTKATGYAKVVDSILLNVPHTGTRLEHALAMAHAVSKAQDLKDNYMILAGALANVDKIIVDENVNDADLEALKTQAKELLDIMKNHENLMNDYRTETMIDVATEVLGDSMINAQPIAEYIRMGQVDSSIMDFLYSCERVSDPLVSVLGTTIRDAQLTRDRKLADISRRIREARRVLGGSDSFMYEKVEVTRINYRAFNEAKKAYKKELQKQGLSKQEINRRMDAWMDANTESVDGKIQPNDNWKETLPKYYIQSQHDWEAFYKDRNTYIRECKKNGLEGFALQDAIEQWESQNMVDALVDETTGRTEKVPNSSYDKSTAFDSEWTDKQKAYYNEMMQIKGEIGSLLPAYAQQQFLPAQRRAKWTEIVNRAIRGKLSLKETVKLLLDHMSGGLKIHEDDLNYVEGGIVMGDAVKSHSSYDNTLLRQIPIYYINPLREQEDLTFDFAGSLQSLAATAINYDAMNGIKELIDTMADVLQGRAIQETDEYGNAKYDVVHEKDAWVARQIRKVGTKFGTSALIDGMIDKHIYNEQLAKGQSKGIWRALQALINYTSINCLAPNVKGAISNYLVGEWQMLIESFGFEYYNFKNYSVAHAIMFGTGATPGNIMDHLSNQKNSLGHLLEERFDPLQDVYSELGSERYLSFFQRMFGGFNIMGMYSAGETLIHLTNMYAILDNEKVLLNGKKVALFRAFDKEVSNGVAKLVIKEGVTDLNGNAIDEAYLDNVKNKIRIVNQKTHGSMNTEDKGLIHRHMVGRAAMNFKQWMVEHYSRRYRGRYFDGTTRTWQEGYYNTVYKLLLGAIEDLTSLEFKAAIHWKDMDKSQKANVGKATAECVTFFGILLPLSGWLGDPKDYKGEFWYRMLIYQVRRLIMDEAASMPHGVLNEGFTLVDSPVASVKTLNGIAYPITGLRDFGKEYERGRHAGKSKYWTNVKKNTIPFYKQIDQLMYMSDEDYVFNIFNNIYWNN